jgi:organic hydroperoxide reductase OsmC/OhrA
MANPTLGTPHSSSHQATITWQRGPHPFTQQQYSRLHSWAFDGGIQIPGAASPHVVRLPLTSADAIDPEEAFVAAIASCHMLSFLYVVCKAGFIVDSYEDQAVGTLAPNSNGKLAITQVKLHPVIRFASPEPTALQVDHWHHKAHDECYIANSVACEITWVLP